MRRSVIGLSVALLAGVAAAAMQDPAKQRLKEGLKDDCADSWIYDDLGAGLSLAKKTGKPLWILFR